MSKVIVRNCSDYDPERVGEIMEELLDSVNLGVEGRSVFVKPNMLAAAPPERCVTTHPVFVKTLIKSLRHRGAKQVAVGDNPGMSGYAKSRRVSRVTGILEAAGDAFKNISSGGEMVNVNNTRMHVSKEILDADVIINLPRLKTHNLTLYTGAIKNMFGMIIGSGKANTHRRFPDPTDFSKMMADICAIRPPDLSILDAVIAMEGNGPNWGSLRKVGKILASTDPVALDGTALSMMGVPHERVPMVGRAKELGLGDHENIELDGMADVVSGFKLPATMRLPKSFIGHLANSVGFYILSRRIPKLIKEKCTSCNVCVEHCPTGSLTMKDRYPTLNKKTCISCFCCMELCSEGAYKLKIKW